MLSRFKKILSSLHTKLCYTKSPPFHELPKFPPETSSKASHRLHCEKRHEFAFVLQYILRWDYKELNITKSPSQNNKESFRQIHVHDFLFWCAQIGFMKRKNGFMFISSATVSGFSRNRVIDEVTEAFRVCLRSHIYP